MKIDLEPHSVWAERDKEVTVRVTVVNNSEKIDRCTLSAHHDSTVIPEGVVMPGMPVQLFPGQSDVIELVIRPDEAFEAGRHDLAIIGHSEVDPLDQDEKTLNLNVEPFDDVRLDIRPKVIRSHRSRETFTLHVSNHGNTARSLSMRGEDAEGIATFAFTPAQVDIGPHSTQPVRVTTSVKRPIYGAPARRELTISAEDRNDPTSATEPVVAQLLQRARIPQVVPVILALIIGFGFWTLLFSSGADDVTDEVNEADVDQQELLDDFLNIADADGGSDPGDNTSAAAVAARAATEPGSIGGSVIAVNDQSPVSATVTVFPDDDPTTPTRIVQATAGDFLLDGLAPGEYILQFEAPGFETFVTPGAIELLGGTDRDIDPVALTGLPGSIIGVVVLRADTAVAAGDIQIEVRRATDLPNVEPVGTSGLVDNRRFQIGEIPTPGDYRVTLISGLYEPRTIDVTVGPGKTLVIDEIDIFGGGGVIAGQVTIAGTDTGIASAQVVVEANDAPLQLAATTPDKPEDQVGRYRIDRLTTPGVYTVFVSAPGFQSRTIEVQLTAGQRNEAVNFPLTSSRASLSGTVDVDPGLDEGVVVTVTGAPDDGTTGPVIASAATVRNADGNSTYRIDDLDAPGTYTVSFARAGVITEARRIRLVPGENPLDITLAPAIDVPVVTDVPVRVVGPGGIPIGRVADTDLPLFVVLGDAAGGAGGMVKPTDSAGNASFTVGPGLYRVSVLGAGPDFIASQFLTIETGVPFGTEPLVLELRQVAYTIGIVVSVSTDQGPAVPISSEGVTLRQTGRGDAVGTTNSSGFVTFEGQTSGAYTIEVSSEPGRLRPIAVTGSSVITDVVLFNSSPSAFAASEPVVNDLDSSGSETITLDGSASFDLDGDTLSFAWSRGGAPFSTLPIATVDQVAGTTSYTLTVTDKFGVASVATVEVFVNRLPVPSAAFSAVYSQGEDQIVTVTLSGASSSDSDGTIVSYQWSEGATMVSTASTPDFQFVRPSSQSFATTYTLTVVDNLGATDSVDLNVVVNQPPLPFAFFFTTQLEGPTGVITEVTLDGGESFDRDGSIVSYQWSEGATIISPASTSPGYTFEVLEPFSTTFTLTVVDDLGATASVDLDVTVNEQPVAIAFFTIRQFGTVAVFFEITLDGGESFDPDGSIVSYQWGQGATIISPASASPTFTFVVDPVTFVGTTYTLTVVDALGTTDSGDVFVQIGA